MAVSKRLRFEIFRRDNHTCRYCGRSAPEVVLRPDHVVPVTLGGKDDPSNLVTSCEDCNSGKSATPPDAALVADVAEDAVRWARARAAAAADLLADLESRVARRDEFLSYWNGWTIGGKNPRLPAEWEVTVDRFMAAGLPMPFCSTLSISR